MVRWKLELSPMTMPVVYRITDTLIVVVNIQPPLNTPPYFTTATPVNAVLNEGDQATWPFNALDNEQTPRCA